MPDGFGVVGVAVLERLLERLRREEAAIFAKRAEQNAVQEFLGAAQNFRRRDAGVFAAEACEHLLTDVSVEGVEAVGEFAADGFGGAKQFVEVTILMLRDDVLGAEEEDEAFEERGVGSQTDGFEAFVGVLLGAFVVKARLAHGGDDDPVAGEIDGVAIGLVHGGHSATGKGGGQGDRGRLCLRGRRRIVLCPSGSGPGRHRRSFRPLRRGVRGRR